MHTALSVSKSIIQHAAQMGISLTHLKLQKILYFVYAYHLVIYNSRLFEGGFSPWNLGPVNEEVYHFFKRYGHQEIVSNDEMFNYILTLDDPNRDHSISNVLRNFGKLPAHILVDLTHLPNAPWSEAVSMGLNRIDDQKIRDDFSRRYMG